MRSAREKLRTLTAYLVAVTLAAALGSIAQTQFNIAAIAALGVEVPGGTRLWVTLQDLAGFAPLYALLVAAALVPGFMIAAFVARVAPSGRGVSFVLAGGVSVACALLVINAVLPMTPIAATRHASGVAALALAGAIGGGGYLAVRPRRRLPAGEPG